MSRKSGDRFSEKDMRKLEKLAPMFTRIEAALGLALLVATVAVASALDDRAPHQAGIAALDQGWEQPQPADMRPMPWPAPVGHRQPRAADVPAERPQKGDPDERLKRLDRVLDGKLTICRC